jgi:hypothetical protein
MPSTLTVYDEKPSGEREAAGTLDFLTERITVRELIRERVYQEVREFNARTSDVFQGLVQPEDTERLLNGYRMKTQRKIDWEKQYEKALKAFDNNGFFLLVDDKQVESLDAEITLTPTTGVSFVRLMPLVGG